MAAYGITRFFQDSVRILNDCLDNPSLRSLQHFRRTGRTTLYMNTKSEMELPKILYQHNLPKFQDR